MTNKRQKTAKQEKEERKAQNQNRASKKSSNSKLKTPPNTLNATSPPLDRYYHVSSLKHPVSKEFNQFCAHTLPLWQ
jgi:hypothetical protein